MCLAIPGKILSIQEDFARSARVNFGGIVREVSLAYVPEATTGDSVIVHVGFAISLLDEAEAMRTYEYLTQMGEVEEMEQSAGSDTLAYAPTNLSNTALLRTMSVEPLSTAICRLRKSASTRVTVSREVPMICAISS